MNVVKGGRNADARKIEQYIDSCIEAGDIYGASFSLITPKGINQYYHGKQGRDEFAVGLDPAMIYDLASVTKVVGTTTRIFSCYRTTRFI